MVRIRVLKRQEKSYIELPADLAATEEIELFQLRDCYYLLSVPLGQKNEQGIAEGEKSVLKKLQGIRFENRTPANVSKMLSEQELAILQELTRKGFVNVFKGSKYKDGVYNISDKVYQLMSQKGTDSKVPAQPQSPLPSGSGKLAVLNSRGFIIIQDKQEAMSLSEQLGAEMKSGAVVGVKGFDGKFYIVTRGYFMSSQSVINGVLKEEMDAALIASTAKLDPDGCLAVLRLLAENGEIIEKKKGVFAPV